LRYEFSKFFKYDEVLFQADYELLKNVDDEDDVVTDGIVANEQNEVKKSEVSPVC
jgi:hypothetical protein